MSEVYPEIGVMKTILEEKEKEVKVISKEYKAVLMTLIARYINLATSKLYVDLSTGYVNYVLYCEELLNWAKTLIRFLTSELRKEVFNRMKKLGVNPESPPRIREGDEVFKGTPFPRRKVEEVQNYCGALAESLFSIIVEKEGWYRHLTEKELLVSSEKKKPVREQA